MSLFSSIGVITLIRLFSVSINALLLIKVITPIEENRDMFYHDSGLNSGLSWGESIANKLPSVEVPTWIPCSERLPEETGEWHNVIISFDNETTASGAWHDKELGFCLRYKDGWIKATGVNAWMPLPEAYKGE